MININEYVSTMFRMFDDERKEVELLCEDGTMNAVVDHFGESIIPYDTDGDTYKVKVVTASSHIFYSWIFIISSFNDNNPKGKASVVCMLFNSSSNFRFYLFINNDSNF